MGERWEKDTNRLSLPATNSGPKPGDFPIGSALSRAAARMLLKVRRDTRKRFQLVTNTFFASPYDDDPPKPEGWDRMPHIEPWRDCGDMLMRMVYLPGVWLKLGEAIPSCSDCGTPFKKTDDYPNMNYYAANCLDMHDPELVH